jgi:tRNA threonylcarbamoyladenosine biosynthesis protein TsaE
MEYTGFLDPPSGALRETVQSVREDLVAHGGAIAWLDGEAVGCLRFDLKPGHLHVRRVAVPPERRHAGIGTSLMDWAHGHARSLRFDEVRLGVRVQLPGNLEFYRKLGYEVIATRRHPASGRAFWDEMSRKL